LTIAKLALSCLSLASLDASAADAPKRPPLTRLCHVALYAHDLTKSRAFYKDFLGFGEPYSITNQHGTPRLTCIKINDHQCIQLLAEQEANSDRLYAIGLETTDATVMRDYLAARGLVVPEKVARGRLGDLNFMIKDPDDHTLDIVQDGWTLLKQGKFMPDTRIATNLAHVGILVGDLTDAKEYYESVLGFRETWRGAKQSTELNWVHERLPEGTGYLEFMLYSSLPPPAKRGTPHHLCLEVPDIESALATLEQRAARIGYTRPLEVKLGINRKRQLNLYDPDGTRVELMEPNTVDGKPSPPSTAPPPTH
jgi:lactoylglutathione lyase